ncbi:MAG: UvrD-helicase domain-containing protein, partial [Firmicutes bacterium]|nr:UvrD-helicase domain-containing protein [Bacillota bacterium]
MEATREQKLAIEKRGTSLLVSAAAGSGKTRVLVERVTRLIIDDGVGLDRMLIVTFTKAAAGEMRERIRESLHKAVKDEKNAERRAYLRRQLSIVSRANISTFHVFALEVIRRYYHVAGLSPGLSVMDDARKTILQNEAMDELLADNFEKASPGFLDFITAYGSLQSSDDVRNIIMSVYELIESLPDPEGWLERTVSPEGFDPKIYMDYAASAARKTFRIARGYFAKVVELLDKTPELQKMAKDVVAQVDAVMSVLDRGDTSKALEAAADLNYYTFRAKNPEKPAYEAVKDKVSYCRDTGKNMIRKGLLDKIGTISEEGLKEERRLMQPALDELKRLTLDFSKRYAEKKAAKKLIDYSDMEHFALRILENEQVCAEYRNKFEHIFVDEYQDSNSIQETLISRIARPDNVFMVGDVKQCIYKFRQAEPELFMERYRRYKSGGQDAGGEVIDLNSNFRSKPEVIDCVNSVFRELMTEESAGIAYDDDAALKEGLPYTGGVAHPVGFYVTDTKDPGDDGADLDEEILEAKAFEKEALEAVNIIKSY